MKSHNARESYLAGALAKRLGFTRVSPYYELPRATWWWEQGWDGADFDTAQQPEFEPTKRISRAIGDGKSGLGVFSVHGEYRGDISEDTQ